MKLHKLTAAMKGGEHVNATNDSEICALQSGR